MRYQRLDEPPLRELPEERFVPTVPDFFVDEVRLDAAAARLVEPDELRDFEAPLLAELLVPLRLVDREADFDPERLLAERDAPDFDPPFEPLREALVREDEDFEAVDLDADLAGLFFAEEREVEDFAAVFLAPDFAEDEDLVPDFAELLAAVLDEDLAAPLLDFAAVFDPELLDAELLAAELLEPELFEPELLEPELLEPDLDELFAAPERDDVPVDFEALLRAVEVPDLEAPDLAEDFEPPVLALDELRRALLFFPPDLVLVAPVSPVNSIVSGFDLSSVGIAASFKGLRVQPSRLQGNVVIPSEFRLTESVESRTRTISVDTSGSGTPRT
jgi:hypothetical protein